MQENYNGALESLYKIKIENDEPYEIFKQIAVSRGAIKRGGEIDDERTANLIINDFRKIKICKALLK